ncbi:hypothetical protein TNCV_1579021 [Trichonephila clavipes]|nr:hypothetical protein TNCV_1579021 [Trichonephila clavipes]
MYDPSSFANPTPLAHADTSRDVLPRGDLSLLKLKWIITGRQRQRQTQPELSNLMRVPTERTAMPFHPTNEYPILV